MPGKIPVRLREEFIKHMDDHNDASLSNEQWLPKLEAAAKKFIKKRKLLWIYPSDATMQYLRIKQRELEETQGEIAKESTEAGSGEISRPLDGEA
jgi:hypothetical protein